MRTMLLCTAALAWLAVSVASADEPAASGAISPATIDDIKAKLDAEYKSLDVLYKHFHQHPELSLEEKETASRLAAELRAAKFEVTEKVGGHGVVAVLRNGKGPTIMVRADMDALPIIENTPLPYASRVRAKDKYGRDVGVMHACGHDVNMTCLVGTARVLSALRDRWSGTLLLVGQPAEEIGAGAEMMLADGLFHRFPRPDFCLATHCDARYAHGQVNFRSGQMQANVDSIDITVLGKGGHGAAPHTTIDPVVLAARIVLDLQTIVAREVNPLQPAVVTVGSIHGGTKHNIIPDEVKLQLTVRTTTDDVRRQVLAAIARIAKGAAIAAGAPEPLVVIDKHSIPSLVNDEELATRTVKLFREMLGEDAVRERPMSLGGEDFSRYIRAGVPGFYYFVGSASPASVAAATEGGAPLPQTHTDAYYPIPEPTIRTGVLTMSAAVLNLLNPVAAADDDNTSGDVGPVGEIKKLHDGFQFTEGPADDGQGNLYFSDIPTNRVYRVNPQGKLAVFLEDSGGINGLMFDAAGTLFACQGGRGRVVSIDVQSKAITVLADKVGDRPLAQPNDLVLDQTGGMYFTDPDRGAVYYRNAQGEVTQHTHDIQRPNGVILSPDEKRLYVIPSGQPQMMVYDVAKPGELGKPRTFCTIEQIEGQKNSGGDGATVDSDGNLYIATRVGVQVFHPDGTRLTVIRHADFAYPKHPANVTFGGPERRTLFITARDGLFAAKMRAQGHAFTGAGVK